MKLFTTIPLLAIAAATALAQPTTTLRVCTYNVLNFGDNDSDRYESLRKVMTAVHPDILVTQRMNGADGAANFLDQVMVPALGGGYDVSFTDGPDTDNGFYYDSTKVRLVRHTVIPLGLRQLDRWTVLVSATGDTLDVYGVHLKAGDAPEDASRRDTAAASIRIDAVALPATHHYLLAGTLNAYASTDTAYWLLTRPDQFGGQFLDPTLSTGKWHGDASFAALHTQSPRGSSSEAATGGGMNDRFDFVLVSPSLMSLVGTDNVLPSSYSAFGNDGAHFGDSINHAPNSAVSMEIAQALHDAADHLPVYVDIRFTGEASGVARGVADAASELRVEPMPATDHLRVRYGLDRPSDVTLRLVDRLGKEVLRHDLPAASGRAALDLDVSGIGAGLYLLELRTATTVRSLPAVIVK